MQATIAVIPGDGVGKEIVPQGVKALQAVAKRFHHEFNLRPLSMGFEAWKKTGEAISRETIDVCQSSQGILMGAIGAAQWENVAENVPPGWGRRQLNRELEYCASIRPSYIYPQLVNKTPVKPGIIQGTDVIVLREMRWMNKKHPNTSKSTSRGRYAADRLCFYEDEVLPILKFSFLLAQSRKKKLVLAAQSSVFQTSKLWLRLFTEMSQQFSDVKIDAMAPDNCAMQLMRNPAEFDVIVSDSTFMGGMLNNLVGLLMGSIGMAPGATVALRDGATFARMVLPSGMYEPIHGTAPLRAGQGIANPIGTVLAAAMLLRYSLNLEAEAQAIERAVGEVLTQGYRTYDIMEPGNTKIGTEEMGDRIAAAILS